MNYWQIASGDTTRDYSEVCLNFGIICIGPGGPGAINSQTIHQYQEMDQWNKVKPIIEVQVGDRIVLKSGRSTVQAVGEVVDFNGSTYNYSNCFNDIDGWDLQHFLKVRWKDLRIKFDNATELHRATMARLYKQNVIEEIETKWQRASFINDKYPIPIGIQESNTSYDEIEEALIADGLRIEDAENTTRTINRVEKLANWYLWNDVNSTEHEIRTFLVVPFLQALGWSAQKIGIEVSLGGRNKLDIVLYEDHQRQTPKILVETKKMYEGSALAINQCINYLSSCSELNNVKRFVVTDGLRYWLYAKKENQHWQPIAYMNFSNKRNHNPAYPKCLGIIGFIRELIG